VGKKPAVAVDNTSAPLSDAVRAEAPRARKEAAEEPSGESQG
jgi:hypothetical protein